uniref:Uncharacterized protein n=1 Tax=Anguilla anguilla TaxID=7936 RepID=A0A0E9QWE2_ANGAN
MTFWKLDDCQMENTEMGGWLLCQYNMENLIKADRIDNQGRRFDLQKPSCLRVQTRLHVHGLCVNGGSARQRSLAFL